MTPEQIEVEFEHFMLDKKPKGDEVFEDDEFDQYDQETEETDSRLFMEPNGSVERVGHPVTTSLPKPETTDDDDDWEDVEIDGFEGY